MKVLVTGASSILGKNLTTELLKIENIYIRFLEHHTPVKRKNCQTFKADIQDAESLIQVCSGIDVVIHMAALTRSGSMKAYFEVNEKGTENLELSTGKIEINIQSIKILSESKDLPMPVFGEQDYPEDIRLKFRFLDLRREEMHKNIILRS